MADRRRMSLVASVLRSTARSEWRDGRWVTLNPRAVLAVADLLDSMWLASRHGAFWIVREDEWAARYFKPSTNETIARLLGECEALLIATGQGDTMTRPKYTPPQGLEIAVNAVLAENPDAPSIGQAVVAHQVAIGLTTGHISFERSARLWDRYRVYRVARG